MCKFVGGFDSLLGIDIDNRCFPVNLMTFFKATLGHIHHVFNGLRGYVKIAPSSQENK